MQMVEHSLSSQVFMSFRLFGVNVEIQAFFWLTTLLLGTSGIGMDFPRLLVWVAVVLVSVLLHEFGHAFAVMRHRIEPEISLHGMGGTTSWRPIFELSRWNMIVISVAGPFAGFLLGGLIYAFEHFLPGMESGLPRLARFAITQLKWVNIGWGVINLLPVMPFDGGHVLEHALGPKRIRLSTGISLVVGILIVAWCVMNHQLWMALLFGLGALQSFQRLQAEQPAVRHARPQRRRDEGEENFVAPELGALLRSARHALNEERFDRARDLAKQVLQGGEHSVRVAPAAAREALEVLAWVELLQERVDEANALLGEARRHGEPDAALSGAILLAKGDLGRARRVLEEARARGDDRKEVVGPLIQVLIGQGEVARAAAVALDIVESLSSEDARKMAEIAFEHGAYDWSARLFGAMFERQKEAEDAYEAARALSLDGQHEEALEWLRRAVEAGFSDRTRAWSDAALSALRAGVGFEGVLPRP